MGRAVAGIRLGVIEAAAEAKYHQRNAEEDGQWDKELGQGHGFILLII